MQTLVACAVILAAVAAAWWYSIPVVSSLPMATSSASAVREDGLVAVNEAGAPPEEQPTIDVWREWFPEVVAMRIGEVAVQASVADTASERTLGLSNTPYLPPEVVKLFVFDAPGYYGIWMKDMLYPIDILWVDAVGVVVHVEHRVSPETFPRSFGSLVPARYVIETVAGFAEEHRVAVGTVVTLPSDLGL